MTIQNYLANLVLSMLDNKKPMEIPDNIDVNELIDIAKRNHMSYMILGALLKTENIPGKIVEKIRGDVQYNVLTTLIQVTELKKLVEAFERAGIKNQPLKGSCMKFMYPSPEMREMSDIDILVDDSMMDSAKNIMLELGYTLSLSVKHHDI